jgi:hypothetical protein
MGGCPQEGAPADALLAGAAENPLTSQKLFPNDDSVPLSLPDPSDTQSGPQFGEELTELGSVDAGGEPALPALHPSPYGNWLLESGSMLPTFVTGLATFGTTTDVTAMVLNNDGTGRVYFRDRLTGTIDGVRAFALFDGDTLVLDFAAETTTDVVFNIALEDYTFFFPVVVRKPDTLGIADEEGNVAIFSRQEDLPPDVISGQLEVVDQFTGVPAPQFFSDMVVFNGDLAYAGPSNLETFDLTTDTVGDPLGSTSSRLLQTTQNGFLWTHCGCGGSRDAFKRTLTTVVDTVSSEDEMGGPITFRAMAYDPTGDRLWLHGRPFDSQFGQFFIVNTNGEPDIVEDEMSFNRDLRALAFDGTELWGIATVVSQTVVRIDPATGKVLDSFEVPDEDTSWSGLVFAGSHMYLLGTNLAGEGVIYRVAHP